ncbi:hypothetical protein CNEO4_120060 [Clostridium neonatale]|nr:hypothetical protein CNEO4_120060 [Clostridium neonatale]
MPFNLYFEFIKSYPRCIASIFLLLIGSFNFLLNKSSTLPFKEKYFSTAPAATEVNPRDIPRVVAVLINGSLIALVSDILID